MIQLYEPSNKNYEMNGEVLHPTRCEASFILKNGAWFLELECPFHPGIVTDAVLAVPTPYGKKQLYRIKYTEKDDDYSYATAYPIFLDAKNDCFLFDVRPTNKNGQEALDIMLNGSKYSASSNISRISTSYFYNKNFIEALNGNDENSFINRWGGEIAYNNYQVIVNERLGSDKGMRAEFGFNLTGINETADMSNVVTSIIPIAYNGRMLPDKETVDSPLINNYPIIYIEKYIYEDIRFIEDIDENEDLTEITVCNTLEELYAALRSRASSEYDAGIDRPKITYEINIIDVSKTDLYKDFEQITAVNLGDTVHCKNKRLNIETSARVIEMTYDCILEKVIDLKLGDYVPSYFDNMTDNSAVIDKVVNKESNTLVGEKIAGLINLFQTKLSAQRTKSQKQSVRAILFEDLDPNSPTYGATCYGTAGLEFTTTRNETDTDWVWGNAFGPYGLIANAIVTGLLSDKLGNFYLDMDTGELRMKNGTFTGKIEGSEFIVTKERTIDITDDDITAIENYLTNGTALTDEQMDKFDINQDGRVDHLDYSLAEMIRNGEISTKFTDTITIYNDGTSKIRLRTLNGNGAFRLETVISTGTVDTRYIYADNIYTDVLNVNAWIKYGDEKMIGLGGRGTEREHLQVWFPNLPLDIWTKKILFRGESLFISAGDTWQSGYYNAHGRITHNQSRIEFSIPVNKRIDSYSLICTSLKMKLRTVDGNFIGEGDVSYDYCTNSDYTISCYPNPNTRTIRVLVDKNIGYDTKANTPIDVEIIDSTFEFN